jgi:ureidoacrylate peracid hydrolase
VTRGRSGSSSGGSHCRAGASGSAAVVVDLQNDFCAPEGWLASIGVDVSGAGAPAAVLETTLPRLRAAGVPVVWLNWGNRPDRANLPPGVRHVYDPDGRSTGIGDPLPNGSRALELGSWSAAVVDGLTVEPQDLHVARYRMSGFWDTPLDSVLKNLRVDTAVRRGQRRPVRARHVDRRGLPGLRRRPGRGPVRHHLP